ncbi:hypothetical protein LI328DRAFT_29849 [Trichoderma asperelloides]|nr:hypothetical protein LI328DRAFT_29849 [Trichoderma asperelloides]
MPFAGHTRAALHHSVCLRTTAKGMSQRLFPISSLAMEFSTFRSHMQRLGVKAGLLSARLHVIPVSALASCSPPDAANGHDWPLLTLLRRLGSVNSGANPTVTSTQLYPGL